MASAATASRRTTSGRASSTAKTTPSQAIRIQTCGRTRRSTIIRWGSTLRKAARSPPAVALSYLLTARAAPSPPAEPMRRARSSKALRIGSAGGDGAALAVSRYDNATAGGDLAAFLNVEPQRMIVDLRVRPHV